MKTEQTNMKVAVRVRPYNSRELEQNQRSIIKVMDNTTLLFDPDEDDDEFFFQGAKQNFRDVTKRVHKKLSMDFDRVFDTYATNSEIFEECTAPLVDSVLNGYNCSVFVYGATGAGKTFTMLGSHNSPGLAYLTMKDLFTKIESQLELRKFNVCVSYLEVYNEQVMDLLSKKGPLKLFEDNNGIVVRDLKPREIFNADELLELLAKGNSNRTQHPTDANAESSRSHAIFQVHIRITDRKTDIKRTVKLSMIDLAGSERAASTKGIGIRFREGANINKSLLALGNCINKLADGLKHIPYRDSNLTRILKDSLGGSCQTLMVANVSMTSLTYEDTYNTLKYASRAKQIRTTLRQNTLKTNMPKDFYVRKVEELMTENSRSKDAIKALEAKLSIMQNTNATSSTTRTYDENEMKNWYRKMDAVYSNVIKVQVYVSGIQSKIKIMSCTIKFKECARNYCQKIGLNKPISLEDIDAANAAIARITKDIEKQTDERNQWNKKLVDAYKDLEKLKKEIKSSKYADILHIYLKSKDWELQCCKEKIRSNHVTNLNTEFATEMKKLRQMFSLSCDALQIYFNDYGISNDMKVNLDELQQIMRLNIFFANDTNVATTTSDSEDTDFEEMRLASNKGKRPYTKIDENNSLGLTSTVKRQRALLPINFENDIDAELLELGLNEDLETASMYNSIASDTDSVFKMPTAKKSRNFNLNETIVLPSISEDFNKTFELGSSGVNSETSSNNVVSNQKVRLVKKNAYINSILSEGIVKPPPNKDQLKNVLLKSQNFDHRGVLKTVTLGIQNENKKYSPNRIRKSPRSIVAKALSSRQHLIKKTHPSSTNVRATPISASTSQAPIVRINRAASFRTKK